jgi:serine/threonine-protein kinase
MDLSGSDARVAPPVNGSAVQVGGGRYRLTDCIGRGGMATVWRAEDATLGRVVAVKLLHREYGTDPVARSRFRAEARAAASISHPNVVSVFDFGSDGESAGDDVPFLVMEFVEGRSLADELVSRRTLPGDEVAAIVEQAAFGLSAAHVLQLVHRDIKPGNLLMTSDGTVKITDFGIARAADALSLTATGSVVGTALYISPEQAAGEPAQPSSDLYSLGVVAYTCLAGTPPFRAATPLATALAHLRDPVPALPASASPPLRDLVLSLLSKNPSDRPQDALEVAAAAHSAYTPTASSRDATSRTAAAGTAPWPITGIQPAEPVSPPPRTAILPAGSEAEAQHRPGWRHRPLTAGGVRQFALGHRRALAALALLVAVVIVVDLVLHARGSWRRVPNVVGASAAAARTAIVRAGLASAISLADGPRSAGYVLAEAPKPGTDMRRGGVVELTVSSGLVQVAASTYAGRSYGAVAAELTALTLRPAETYVVSSSDAGQVLSISPEGAVPVGSVVQVDVAAPPVTAPGDHGGDGGSGPPPGGGHPKPPH